MINVFKIEIWAWLEGGGGVAEWIKADLSHSTEGFSVQRSLWGLNTGVSAGNALFI